ncbi:hypothetical protein Pelo_14479 [Pelomyxa schiedti]|nr:hypothetical protein Pelo_14479 [Pelomyxa schiedti]
MLDLVADAVVAKKGYPEMSIAAAYGSPMFNLVIGMGLGLLISTIAQYPHPYTVELFQSMSVAYMIGIPILVATVLCVSLRNFQIEKWWGVILMAAYSLEMVIQILMECGIIPSGIFPILGSPNHH